MYLHGLLNEDSRACHLTTRKLEGQLLRVALFSNKQNEKVALIILSLLGGMCSRLFLVGHGTCDTKLDQIASRLVWSICHFAVTAAY